MAGKASRQHISKLVPESEVVLTWLLVATAVVNSAVSMPGAPYLCLTKWL